MTPAELQDLIAELRSEPVVDVETFARACGVGRTLAFETLRETGEMCGIRAIRVGRRIRIPAKPILDLLGYGEESAHVCACAPTETTP